MLKNLDQSVDLLCDFYNLDLQPNEQVEDFLTLELGLDGSNLSEYGWKVESIIFCINDFVSEYISDLGNDNLISKEEIIEKFLVPTCKEKVDDFGKSRQGKLGNKPLRIDFFTHVVRVGEDKLSDLSNKTKHFVGRKDKERIKRFLKRYLRWGENYTYEDYWKNLREFHLNWFKNGVLELLYDYYTVRPFISNILDGRIADDDVLLRIGSVIHSVFEARGLHMNLIPKNKSFESVFTSQANLDEIAQDIKNTDDDLLSQRVSDGNGGFWKLDDVEWDLNLPQLLVSWTYYSIPMGFIIKTALADSIQAIINGEKSVRKCILCDRIFRVPKVNGDLKKYCGSGCRTKASKEKNKENSAL